MARYRSLQLSLVLLAAGAAGVAPATAEELCGVIKGTVTDQDGGTLPGATVTINSPSLIRRDLTANTNLKGEFRFPLLDPGT